MNNKNWLPELVRCLELGTTDPALADSFTQISSWMRGADNVDPAYKQLQARHSQEWIALRYEEFLDRLFVAENAVAKMFPTNLTDDEAKMRYRQLIRIFHPDRGAHEPAWLNYRAERVNKAFDAFEHKPSSPMVDIVTPKRAPHSGGTSGTAPNFKVNTKIKYKPDALREKLGDARQVQRRIVGLLLLGSFALILLVYLSNIDVSETSRSPIVKIDASQSVGPSVQSQDDREVLKLSSDAQIILDGAEWLKHETESNDSLNLAPLEDRTFESERTVMEEELPLNFSDFNTQSQPSRLNQSPVAKKRLQSADRDVAGKVKSDMGVPELDVQKAHTDKDAPNSMRSVTRPGVDANVGEGVLECESGKQYAVPVSEEISVIASESLNVRSGPSKNCKLVTSLQRGATVRKLKRVNFRGRVWAEISWTNNNRKRVGWVSERFLDIASVGADAARSNAPEAQVIQVARADSRLADMSSAQIKPGEKLKEADRLNVQPTLEEQLRETLAELENAFEGGESERLAALYAASGRENSVRGLTRIERQYSKLFKRTTSREVKYNISSFDLSNADAPSMRGTMISSFSRLPSGREIRTVANFKFVMTKVGGDYKIKSFEWREL